MGIVSHIEIHPKVNQTGTYGYLLWLRSAMPSAYVAVANRVPQVLAFEKSLRQESGLGCCGLGQDDSIDLSDFDAPSIDTSDIDTSAFDSSAFDSGTDTASSAISVDYTSQLSDASIVSLDQPTPPEIDDTSIVAPAPELPPGEPPPAASTTGSLASAASAALPAIAAIVKAVAPVVTAAINNSTASINQATVAKTVQAGQIQLAQALAGAAPLTSGVVMGPNGSYVAAVAPAAGSLAAVASGLATDLSSTVAGVPVWLLALGGIAAAYLLSGD
jgi:hypothetical protein